MSVTFGAAFTVRNYRWTDWKSIRTTRLLSLQSDDDGTQYTIWGYDGQEVFVCTIYKGTVPDGVIAGGYSQATNDSDKSDFETNFTANSPAYRRRTYSAEGSLAGANNKDMLAILNPGGSGKVMCIYEVWGTVPSSSGTTVIIPFELRKTNTLTGGTAITPAKWDSDDPASAADVRHTPTGLTDQGLVYTYVEQINTAQGSTRAQTEEIHDGNDRSPLKPIVLRPGEGLFLKQVASNTSTFRMGVLWTEE